MKDLALIVLNYNSEEDCITCITNLLKVGELFEIVVVDNCSPDGSFERLKKKYDVYNNVSVIQTSCNGGYSAGNNFGMKYAIDKFNPTYLGIINPDVIIDNKELIPKLLHFFNLYQDCVVIGGATKDSEGVYDINKAAWNIPTIYELVVDHLLFVKRKKVLNSSPLMDDLLKVDCIAGCFFLTRTEFMKKIGFLDESVFLYNEENILGIKCKLNGVYEAIYTKGFYIHNHVHNKHIDMPFSKKIMATHNSYLSRKILCKMYYSARAVPLLMVAEFLNKIYLCMAFLYGKLHKHLKLQ